MALQPTLPTEDITLYDFMFNRPLGDETWFLDAITGETRTATVLKERVDALGLGLQNKLGLSYAATRRNDPNYTIGPVVSLVSANDIDFGTAIWASHLAGATVAPSNAGGTVEELTYQLRLTGAQLVIAHPTSLDRARKAARNVGIKDDHVVVLARGKWADLQQYEGRCAYPSLLRQLFNLFFGPSTATPPTIRQKLFILSMN